MFKYFLLIVGLILILRFVFRFLLPVFQITRSAQQKMKQMQEQMNEMQQAQTHPPKARPTTRPGDYIEYEEVK
jgi:type II secretory pathway component PulM